ncbi:MAG: DUF2007 domain-containing protein [Burkholderiales bacterium]|jgi:hypothetical protein|nr:DUF2007 domain-containing protein [Burkholderiales bacterium]
MIPIYRPDNPVDLALAENLLMAEGIPYFVHNKHYGGLYPGVQIELLNARTVMVPEAFVLRAYEVLAALTTDEQELPPPPPSSPEDSRPRFSLGQMLHKLFKRRRKETSETSDDTKTSSDFF